MKKQTLALIGIAAVLLLLAGVFCGAAAAADVTITFKAGDGTGTDYEQTVESGVLTTLDAVSKMSFTAPTDKEFIGWYDGTKYYTDQQAVKVTGTLTLTAQWGEVKRLKQTDFPEKEGEDNRLYTISENGYYQLDENIAAGRIKVDEGVLAVLDLNGKTLDANRTGSVVDNKGVLTLVDSGTGGKITGGSAKEGGGVNTSGTFTMNSGTISYNWAYDGKTGSSSSGGGVYTSGTFTMNGGTISDNEASDDQGSSSDGGGVYIDSKSTFVMNNGTISNNKVTADQSCQGGGVFVNGSASFILINGTISNNQVKGTSDSTGGGVFVFNPGKFTMEGGTITGNSVKGIGGGVSVDIGGTFSVSGSPVISGNTKEGSANNVYLNDATRLTLAGPFTGDIRISEVWGTSIGAGNPFGLAAEGVREGASNFKNDDGTLCGTVDGSDSTLKWTEVNPITRATVTLSPDSYEYDGTAKTPEVTVTDGDTTLVKDTDYTVAYSGNTNAGTAKVTITGIGKYGGTKEVTFTITPKSITGATIGDIADQTYTGSQITPEVTVTDGGTPLTKDTDYTVAYGTNVDAGTDAGLVTVTGTGNYTESAEKTFNITAKPISECAVASISGQEYTGSQITPDVTVTDGSTTLTKDTDYTVAYSNNTNVGTATVTITGKGNYSGETSATFEITPKSITEGMIGTISDQEYTGSQITPDVTVTDGSTTLTKDTDYTVTYGTNVDAGTDAGSVTVTGTGNYTGSAEKTFNITAKPISECAVESIPDQTYTGSALTPAVTVKNGNITLAKDTDYTVAYSNNTSVGTATVTITAKGTNYSGETSATFSITPKPLAKPTADTTSFVYTGQEQTYTPAGFDAAVMDIDGNKMTEVGSQDVTVSLKDKTNYKWADDTTADLTFTFTIAAKPLSGCTVESIPDQTYTGSPIEPTVTVKNGSITLVKDTDYTVTYGTNVDAGTEAGSVTITAKGTNYTGSAEKKFNITPKSITEEMIGTISDQEYTGSQITPDVTVTDGSTPLTKDTDYTVAYGTNVDAGTDAGSVTVTGTGNYTGSAEKKFNITPKLLAKPTADTTSFVYTGQEQTYTPAGFDAAVMEIAGNKMTDAGSQYVTVSLKDKTNYKWADNTTDDLTFTFTITAKPLSECTVASIPDQTYTGSPLTPAVTVTDGSITLVKDTDYTVSYSDNTNVGTATVTITAAGTNYSGSTTTTFQIVIPGYTVTYNANGATAGTAPASQLCKIGETIKIAGPGSLAKDNHTFVNWNTRADGTGDSYTVSEEIELKADLLLYARWQENQEVPSSGGEVDYNIDVGNETTKKEGITVTLEKAWFPENTGVSRVEISSAKAEAAEKLDFDEEKDTVLTVLNITLLDDEGEEIHEVQDGITVSFIITLPADRSPNGVIIQHYDEDREAWEPVSGVTWENLGNNQYRVSFTTKNFSPFAAVLKPTFTIENNTAADFGCSKSDAVSGTIITLTPRDKSVSDKYLPIIIYADGSEYDAYSYEGGYQFVMPEQNVTIEKKLHYREVIVPQQPDKGLITVDSETAFFGQLVSITVTPEEGYKIKEVKVIRRDDGSMISTQLQKDGTYQFSMPASGVEISATITKRSSGSSPQVSPYWATPTPTATPTVTPTPAPTQEMPTVKPVTTQTQTAKSPAAVMGVLAGLGAAMVALRRR